MTVQISKFGDFLMSHPAGKDASLLAESRLFKSLDSDEEIILDFADVKVLTPSWAEEFIYGFQEKHCNSLSFIKLLILLNIKSPIKVYELKIKKSILNAFYNA